MSKYDTYDTLDFVQDDQFIKWVNDGMPGEEAWAQWTKSHPEKEKKIQEAIQIVQNLRFKTEKVTSQKTDQLWQKIDQRTTAIEKKPAISRRIFLYAAAAAAVLLIGFFTLKPKVTLVETLYAEKTQHQLPDGTIVYLNVDSELSYNEKKWSNQRKVKLTGEGFFEVMKGSTFEVETKHGSVVVLGTSFNVRSRENLEVVCFTGKVEVNAKNSSSVKLLPGSGVKYDTEQNDLEMIQFTPETHRYWRRGSILFRATPLSQVFSEMERQFDVKIEFPENIGPRAFNGEVNLDNLALGLSDISETMRLKYERNQGTYQFFEK